MAVWLPAASMNLAYSQQKPDFIRFRSYVCALAHRPHQSIRIMVRKAKGECVTLHRGCMYSGDQYHYPVIERLLT